MGKNVPRESLSAPHPAHLVRPLAGTQPFEEFSSKPDFGGPNGLFPPGNPSIEVGGFAPLPQSMGFTEGRGRLDPTKSGFEQHFSKDWVLARGPPIIFDGVVLGPAFDNVFTALRG